MGPKKSDSRRKVQPIEIVTAPRSKKLRFKKIQINTFFSLSYNINFWRAILTILSIMQFFGIFVAVWLAYYTYNNIYWKISEPIYKKKYGIDVNLWLPVGLLIQGGLFCLLCVSGLNLVKNPKNLIWRGITALFSLVMCVGLMYAGNYTLWTAGNVER